MTRRQRYSYGYDRKVPDGPAMFRTAVPIVILHKAQQEDIAPWLIFLRHLHAPLNDGSRRALVLARDESNID